MGTAPMAVQHRTTWRVCYHTGIKIVQSLPAHSINLMELFFKLTLPLLSFVNELNALYSGHLFAVLLKIWPFCSSSVHRFTQTLTFSRPYSASCLGSEVHVKNRLCTLHFSSSQSAVSPSVVYQASIRSLALICRLRGVFPALGLWPNPSVFISELGRLWALASRTPLSTSC